MREIKFRGKRVDNDEWIYGYYGVKGEGTDIEEHCIFEDTLNTGSSSIFFYFNDITVISSTVGQFTGLIDNNKEEAYEHDLLKDDNGDIWEVKFEDGKFVAEFDDIQMDLFDIVWKCEITGTIHDNPKLMK